MGTVQGSQCQIERAAGARREVSHRWEVGDERYARGARIEDSQAFLTIETEATHHTTISLENRISLKQQLLDLPLMYPQTPKSR